MLTGLGDDASECFSVLEGRGFCNPGSHCVKFMTLNVLKMDLNLGKARRATAIADQTYLLC